ncbi:MAG: arginine--tRNA ligase [Synergistaceae bacterium]|nr:arginine--tRNA ligase [Synergistaceae bacterium]
MEGVEATLRRLVGGAVREAASEKGISLSELPEIVFEKPRREEQGDLSTNCAMQMSRLLGEKPAVLAKKIAASISDNPYLDRVETAGPGFINFFLSPKWMGEVLTDILAAGEKWGRSDLGRGRKVQVEFVSANPTGPLHVGHGRGAAVGDMIAGILEFTGWKVEREYYINDAGLQMDLLGLSTQARYFEIAGSSEKVPFPEDGYRGQYIYHMAEEIRSREGDRFLAMPPGESLPFFRTWSGEAILESIRKDLADFGVNFDVWFSEKTLYERDLVPSAMDILKERGFAFEQEGALWFKSTDFSDEKDRVLIRGNGAPTYFASDIAYHKDKFDRGFDRVIDVWGADHHGYVPRMKAGVQSLGRDPEDLDILLIQFVNLLRDGVQVAMSTRSGEFVTLRDVTEEVGTDAARFFFAMRRNDSHLDFDLELAKRTSNDNPVYYVQYAHARICSVMREAETRGVSLPSGRDIRGEIFASAEEKKLMARLADFPQEVEKASRELAPHILVKYVSDLAADFHSFYNAHRVLGEAEEVTEARLLLAKASGMIIASVLGLLGVRAPERM